MEEQRANHNMIEYILAVLSMSDGQLDINSIVEGGESEIASFFNDAQNIQAAHEIIKFMDEMPGGFLIYCADRDERIIYANRALVRIFGCVTLQEFRELTGNSFKGLVHPEDLESVEQSIREQVFGSLHDLDYVEYRIVRADGQVRWVEDYGHFVYTKIFGNIFYVFMGDATDKRRRREQELQNLIEEYDRERKQINQEHLRRMEVIEGLSVNYESILYVDLDTDQVLPYRLSERAERQFGEKCQIGGYIKYAKDYASMWVHPEDKELVAHTTTPEHIREKLANQKTYYINYRILNNGELQYLQLRVVNVGSKEHISQIVMGYRRVDMEIRREMEQNQVLEGALNDAKLASIAKSTFLSNMSHDMRTPLNGIFGFTSLAKKHINDPILVREYLEKIEASSKLLLDLIDKVLEISWAESNDVQLEEVECNLCDIMQDVQKSLFVQASEKNIAFSLDVTGMEHRNIYADSDKLKQLLLYLGSNAVTYTKNGGRVRMAAKEIGRLPNDYATYQFIVEDTGIGISSDFLERIFEPFEREKNTTFSGVHGTGLGLTIAKNIVEVMGGQINVDSALGKGTKFVVTLRFRMQTQPVLFYTDTGDVIAALQNQQILLVEDNEINLEIENEILGDLGFVIDTASNGKIAVEKVKNSKPGDYVLILMDIQMPIMDGREAARQIRRLENYELAHIPIIALSADAYESDKRLSIECGMDAHLTKPIDVALLLETIAKIMQIHRPLLG